jgi:hypothetical protein
MDSQDIWIDLVDILTGIIVVRSYALHLGIRRHGHLR